MANLFFLLLTPAEPNHAVSILAENYEQLLLWQLVREYALNLTLPVTASAYESWGLVPQKKFCKGLSAPPQSKS